MNPLPMAESLAVLSGTNSSTNDTFFIPTNNNSGNNIKKKKKKQAEEGGGNKENRPELVARRQSKSQPHFFAALWCEIAPEGVTSRLINMLKSIKDCCACLILLFLAFFSARLTSGGQRGRFLPVQEDINLCVFPLVCRDTLRRRMKGWCALS